MARLAEVFLAAVWSKQPDGYFFVSVKDWTDQTNDWDDYPIAALGEGPDLSKRAETGKSIGPYKRAAVSESTVLGKRLRDELPTKQDLYFCPNSFEQPRRLRKYAQSTRWLFADLDEADPREFGPLGARQDVPVPTIAWATSPNRYQALWLLDRSVSRRRFEWLNQRLTYFTGADRGGWSSTKVLRVPGSISNKRDTPYLVDVLWARKHTHAVPDMIRLLQDVPVGPTGSQPPPELILPDSSPTVIINRYRRRLSPRARQLLRTKSLTRDDDRSARLWELEHLLLDAGMKPNEVYAVVQQTPWNKYRHQRREQRMLWSEICKAATTRKSVIIGKRAESPKSTEPLERAPMKKSTVPPERAASPKSTGERKRVASPKSAEPPERVTPNKSTATAERDGRPESTVKENRTELPESTVATEAEAEATRRIDFIRWADFLTTRLARPTWLVKDIWGEEAHGVLGGEAKTFKSLFSLDLAVSVASGTPFLNHFQVPKTGPVFIIQEENEPGLVHDRLWRIGHARGLAPGANTSSDEIDFVGADLPIRIANNQGFDLTDDADMRWLVRQVRRRRPVLVILDPLYLMTPGIDENSAVEITPILRRLLQIKQRYGCGILLIHHFSKPKSEKSNRRAHRLSGSSVFHRWYSSAIFIDAVDDNGTVAITSQHRGHGSSPSYLVRFDLGSEENHDHDLTYNIDIGHAPDDLLSRNGKDTPEIVSTTDELMDVLRQATGSWLSVQTAATELGLTENAVRKRATRAGLNVAIRRINGRNKSAIKVPDEEEEE